MKLTYQRPEKGEHVNWTNPGLSIWDSWKCATADIDRVNNGKVTSFGVQFPTPKEPFVCPSYETFRRGVNKLRDPDTFGAKFSKQAKESRTQGAGKPLRATAPGEIITYDTWEMPLLFCVDGETGIPLGTPQFTNSMDVATKIMCGGVVECAPPTMSTIAQLILHTMSPKVVTPFFAEKKQYAGLAGVCLKPSEMLGDNALHHLAKAAEDNGMSAGISLRYAGKKKPRHKAFHERAYLTISTYVFNKIPGAKYDIKLMREYGYNPAEHKIVTIQQLRALTAAAIDFYNTEDHDGLMSRPPLLVFDKLKAKYPLPAIYDLDQVRNAIGDVIYKVVLSKDGITLWNDVRFGGIEAVNALLSDLMGTQYRRTQNATVEVKVKYNKNNIGSVRVWNPVRKFYVRLENLSIEGAEGMPLWQYERAREIAKAEKLAFHTPIERAYAREHVIKAARSVAAEVTAAGNRTLALLGMLPRVKEIIGEYIDIERITTSARDVEGTVPHDMADDTRLDATVEPRRSARRAEDPDRDPRDAAKPRQNRKSTTTGPRDAGGLKPNQAARPATGDWADFA